MNIVHLIQSLDPCGGGPPVVCARLAAAQAQLGHEVCIFCYDTGQNQELVHESFAGIPGIKAVRLAFIPFGGRVQSWFDKDRGRALRQTLAEADFVQLHGVWECLLLAGARLARRLGVPYAVTPHGMLDPWSLSQSRQKKAVALRLGYWKMLDRAGFIHVLNSDEQEGLAPLGLTAPAKILSNGVFLEEIDPLPEADAFRRRHPELASRPFVLFLSRLHYKKGLDQLAPAFAELARERADVDLVVVGPDDGAQAEFERLIAQAGLTDRVHVLGPLYDRQKYEALVAASCFCLPSRQEGFSVAITEALACGVPVVITEGCHFPEVAEVGAGEIVPLKPNEIAAALGRVLSDAGKARAMGEAGRELVETRFTWKSIAEAMVEHYQQAIASRR